MKKVILFVLCVMQVNLISCATIFNSSGNRISVNSNPSGAKVYVDGNYKGITPIKVKLDRKDDHTLVLRHQGKERTYQIESVLGAGWVALDILGGLIPIVVDGFTGSWYSLTPKKVMENF